jgi:hypothetical protein
MTGPLVGVVYDPVHLNLGSAYRWVHYGADEILLHRDGQPMIHVRLSDVVAWHLHGTGR